MGNNRNIISPRIERLCNEVKNNGTAALERFWNEVSKTGTPLIESIENDKENYLVTLLWREEEPIERIAAFGEMFGFESCNAELEKLQDTDLWYRTWVAKGDTKSLYMFIVNEKEEQEWDELDFRLDPLNTSKYVCVEDEKRVGEYYIVKKEESCFCLPNYKEKSWTMEREDIPKGNLELIDNFQSNILNNKRRIWVYTPDSYSQNSEPLPLAVFTDGWEYLHVTKIITTLNNLIADHEIPAICVVFIETSDNRDKELTCSEEFQSFVMGELLPWMNQNYNIRQSNNLFAGFSYGGITAAFIAYNHPEVFSKVLCQSGAMYWNSEDDESKKGCILETYKNGIKKLIDFYMTLGEFEKSFEVHYSANRDFYDILNNKGYNAQYHEFCGGHTYTDIDMELGTGLIYLLKNK
ncbi:alpha/beta hydrolase-fold protein [Hathewaya proteolytica]|nr:alpha/beta hydrolase-fold protein [Hathewaya proteolytica]